MITFVNAQGRSVRALCMAGSFYFGEQRYSFIGGPLCIVFWPTFRTVMTLAELRDRYGVKD